MDAFPILSGIYSQIRSAQANNILVKTNTLGLYFILTILIKLSNWVLVISSWIDVSTILFFGSLFLLPSIDPQLLWNGSMLILNFLFFLFQQYYYMYSMKNLIPVDHQRVDTSFSSFQNIFLVLCHYSLRSFFPFH